MIKICLPKEEDGFNIHEHSFCEVPAYLITPKADAKWTPYNLYFRSLIVDKETKEVLSSGFPKFFNYGEKPDCYPNPENHKDWSIQEKLDGSLVICDYVNEKFSMRTRGSVSYINQPNFEDFQILPKKYPHIIDFLKIYSHISLLFEIVTPNNIIVIRPSDIDFHFLGAVDKATLQTASIEGHQRICDILHIPTPKEHKFDNLTNMIESVKSWKGQEGIVLCYNNNQSRVKIKSDWYCWIHRIKSELNSQKNLIEFYVNEGMPNYEKFYETIKTNFDWELAEQMKLEISKICETGKKVFEIKEEMERYIKSIHFLKTRKEKAESIKNCYGKDKNNRSSMVFHILDGKQLTKDQLIKLMHQCYE